MSNSLHDSSPLALLFLRAAIEELQLWYFIPADNRATFSFPLFPERCGWLVRRHRERRKNCQFFLGILQFWTGFKPSLCSAGISSPLTQSLNPGGCSGGWAQPGFQPPLVFYSPVDPDPSQHIQTGSWAGSSSSIPFSKWDFPLWSLFIFALTRDPIVAEREDNSDIYTQAEGNGKLL